LFRQGDFLMPQRRIPVSTLAERELGNCCAEGLSALQARLRLVQCGVVLSERTISRRMQDWRVKQAQLRQAEAAGQRRLLEMEAIGRGLASVRLDAAGVVETLTVAAPEFRRKQADTLRDLLRQFLECPTAELLCGLSVDLYAFLVGAALAESLGRRDG